MNYQRLLAVLLAIEFIVIIIAFGLAIALKAKEASLWEDLGTLNPSLAPFDNVPDFINWFLFVGAFSFVSLLALMIITVVSEIIYTSVYLIIHFLNWMFYLISFVLFVTSDIGSAATCDGTSGTNLHNAFCQLPRACKGISAVAWIVLLFGFFGRWWAARHHASGRDARLALYPAMTERKHPATTSEAV